MIAGQYRQTWVAGKKYPLITFPSGIKRELIPTQTEGQGAIPVFDGLEVYYHNHAKDTYFNMRELAEERGYRISVRGDNVLTVTNPANARSYELTFDERAGVVTNLVVSPDYAMELLGGEQRALLPPLYHNELIGSEAISPIKFFTPDAGWTWYPTEFDGNDIFFGLVAAGIKVELRYFSLMELEGVRGHLGLPIERDLYFDPSMLQTLQDLHRRRGC